MKREINLPDKIIDKYYKETRFIYDKNINTSYNKNIICNPCDRNYLSPKYNKKFNILQFNLKNKIY